MLSMEGFLGTRALGEESLQMWDLNKRLEAYLARVKFLEEENEVLRAEIQSAKGSPGEDSWRTKYEEELRALRATLDDAFREKCLVEMARDNLYEEIQYVKSRCQKEQAAREEAKKQLSMSKKELEEERRAQIWLKERALQLEKEVEALLEVHEEEKAGLDHEIASFSQSLESFRCVPVAFQPVEVEDYSKRLSEIWKGAVETYKTEVSQLESSLCQAKENLWKAVEDNQQSQLQLQHLEKDLAGLKARKDMLEESLSRQWQEQRGEAEKFQLALEALEQEKQALRVQIAQVLEDRQQLMHLKMSLSLEVATYRTLLEAESTRLQMPAGEYKLANGLRDVKLEMSSSKLQPSTPESRRLLSWDHRMSPSIFPKAEAKMQLAKTQSDSLKALTPKSKSPVTREFQKINSVLQSPVLKAAGAARDHGAAGRSVPSPVPPSTELPAASMEAAAGPSSQEQPKSLSPTVPLGPEPSKENKQPHEETTDETQDLSEEPPGKSPTPQLLYPDQLVTEALQDALKEVRDDAQPKEEPILRAERATEGYSVGNAPELPGWTAADHPTEEVNTAEVASFETLLEDRAGEDMHEQPDMESTAQWDGATSHQELGPSSKQEEESTPDFLVAAQSEIETQEEMRSLEEEGSKEEEMPTLLSPGESREPEFVHNTAESLLGKDTLASSQTDDEHWEGSSGHPSQAAAMGGGLEEPEQGEDDVEAVSTEALHLSEDEERQEPWSPSREEEGCDFPGETKEVQEEESLQREIQATHACPMESHPVLPGESHLEEDLVEGKQESLGQQEMPLCETDPATDEERREEICPEHEPSNIEESISAEEASSKDEEDTMGEEIADRARDSKGEMGEPREEALEGEDLRTEGKPLGHDDLRQEEVILDAPGDLQENGFEDDILEEEDLETLPREEVLGSGDDDNYQKHCPEDWEMKGEEDIEESPGTEDANITSQEPAWAGDILKSTEVPETEETEGISPAEIEEMGKDDEDNAGSNLMSHQEQMLHETEQEAEPALGLVREVQEGHEDQSAQVPRDEELVAAPEASWEVETRAEDELASEPDELEKASTISAAFQQAPGDYAESDESQEEVAQRAEELGQELGTAKTIQLEDTLPDSTPLHLYEGEMLAAMAASPNPLATEDATEPALGSEIALEEEGELEGSHTPTTPLEESHEEEEAGMEPAPAAEHAEEEEGYFMVSAPNQEAPSSEEAEISEDFEEIKVEAADASKDDLKAPRETSPAPGDEEHFEAFVGEADEGIQMPTEECEMPKAEDFTAEEDEAVPTAEPSSPPGEGRFAGIADEPERGAESPDADSRAREGQGPSEGFAAEPDEEVGSAIEPEHGKSGGAEFPSHDCPGQLGAEETLPGQEDESGAAELTPPGGLQVQMDPPGEDTPEESALVMQPSLAPEDETLDGDSLSLPEAVQTSDDDPPPPSSSQEASDQGGSDPGHDGFAGTTQDNVDGLDLPAKMPVDVMKDSDILEIVEQALEFNQELMLEAGLAEAEQQAPGATEPTRPPHELGEDDGDSSPVSSSEEEPTVHETTAATASSTKEPATSGVIRAEHQELNGLHSEASLEDLVEFPEELPNGIAGAQPATRQDGRVEQEQFGKVPVAQELPGEEAEPAATSAVVPPPPEELGYGEAPAGINPTQGVPLLGKHVGAESASAASALGDELLRLAPSQPPRCQLKDEQESWSSEDE